MFGPGAGSECSSVSDSGVAAARQFLAMRERPTAIFAANDDMAAGVLAVAHELGIDAFMARLDSALSGGLRLVQLREKSMPPRQLAELATEVARRCHSHAARLLVNGDFELARQVQADGVHLTANQLRELSARPDFSLVGASTHDADELARAATLGCDFAVLGPVKPTQTHPDATCLGWQAFQALANDAELPVYALGGLGPADVRAAAERGAHGVAMMRGAWAE